MANMVWSRELNTGIDVIDNQHKRIVEYINELSNARERGLKKDDVSRVIDNLVEYTLSHFAFEESLQEEAKYPFTKAHKKVHELFTRKVGEYQERFKLGEDITEELNNLLITWLFNHIKRDDADYVEVVKKFTAQSDFVEKKKGLFSRLFS